VRIYGLERSEKRRAGKEKYEDGKEDTLPDIRAMSVARRHKWDELLKSWERSWKEFEAAWSDLKADMKG
jgi:hypothetical protein